MRQVETTGHTVDEAVDRALAELGVDRDEVEIEIADPGSRGVLGLGARDARVRVALKGGPATVAHTLMVRLLREMGVAGSVYVHEQDGAISIQVSGEGLGALIGRGGATLGAVQLLVGQMVARQSRHRVRVVIDVAGYRERRRVALEDLAREIAERVLREARAVELEPMDAAERRIIHTKLATDTRVVTFSRGEGAGRHVVVAPRDDTTATPDDSE